jgi:hypothetical protein
MTLEERKAAVRAMIAAIAACDPQDALEGLFRVMKESIGPGPLPEFDDLRNEAGWWADVASPVEVEAYVQAGMTRLCKCSRGRKAKLHLARHAMARLSAEDRADLLREWGGESLLTPLMSATEKAAQRTDRLM